MDPTDAFEAAKLAAMVGGQLKKIDQFSVERTSNPANKININNFIASVKNPAAQITPARYLAEPPAGFAPAPPEEYIQAQVPDVSIGSLPTQATPIQPPLQAIPAMPVPAPVPAPAHVALNNTESLDLLKNIDKTLSSMLAYMKKDSSNE